MENEIFEYKYNFYEIKQIKCEPREIYMQRVWFILHNIENNKNYEEVEQKSKIWINEKIFNCKYK